MMRHLGLAALVLASVGLFGSASYGAAKHHPAKATIPHGGIAGTVLDVHEKPIHRAHARVIHLLGGRRGHSWVKTTDPKGHFLTSPEVGTYLIEVTHANGGRASAVVTTEPGKKTDVVFHLHRLTTHLPHNRFSLGVHKTATNGASRSRPAPPKATIPRTSIAGTVLDAHEKPIHWAHARIMRLLGERRISVITKTTDPRGHFLTRREAGTYLIEVTHADGGRASAVVTTVRGEKSEVVFHLHRLTTHLAHNRFQLGVHKLGRL